MKKKLLAVALVAAMAMGLMACGGGSSSGSSDAAAGDAAKTEEAAAPAASGEGDIRLVNGKIEVDAALKAAAEAYKAETGVTVAIESMGGGVNIQDTLKGYFQADNMPDIFVCGSDQLTQMQAIRMQTARSSASLTQQKPSALLTMLISSRKPASIPLPSQAPRA